MSKKTQKGFTLFIAVVVSSLLLLVVLSISNLAFKETILSSAGKESSLAFYASDSGIECALFWDLRDPAGQSAFISPEKTIKCGVESSTNIDKVVGFDVNDYQNFDVSDPATYDNKPDCDDDPVESTFVVSFENKTCSEVTVRKCFEETTLKTTIESKGRSTCDVSNPRRFERAIRVIYPFI